MNKGDVLFAVIEAPRFALQAVLRAEEGLADKPVVLVDAALTKPVVMDLTRPAAEEGVELGLTVAQAMGRCSELEVRYCSPQAEASASRALFDCAYSLTPRVEESLAGVCTLDLQGVNRAALMVSCERIVSDLWRLGLWGRIGIASTPALALLASKRSKRIFMVGEVFDEACRLEDFLAVLPVDAAEPSERMAGILEQWGVRTLKAFVALPRESVAKRLGMEGTELWDRVSGRVTRVLQIAVLPEVFEEALEFEYAIESLEPLLFLARRFLDQLEARLRTAGKAAAELNLVLSMGDGVPYRACFEIPEPTRDAEALLRMLGSHLDELQTDAAVVGIEISITPCLFQEQQIGLFETSLKNPRRFSQTLARLAGVVGSGRVGRPVLEETWRPDDFTLEAMPVEVEPLGEEDDCFERSFKLPMRRYRPLVEVEVGLKGERPAWVRGAVARGSVKACRGPWLSSGEWWQPSGWNRAEWDVELSDGGLYRLAMEKKRWFLEGVYG